MKYNKRQIWIEVMKKAKSSPNLFSCYFVATLLTNYVPTSFPFYWANVVKDFVAKTLILYDNAFIAPIKMHSVFFLLIDYKMQIIHSKSIKAIKNYDPDKYSTR